MSTVWIVAAVLAVWFLLLALFVLLAQRRPHATYRHPPRAAKTQHRRKAA